jgi:signal transduction histidine kinase
MARSGPSSRDRSLREAAAIIFALGSVLPLLLFVFFVWRFDLAHEPEAQAGVLLSLVVSVLGFLVFRRLLAAITELVRTLQPSEETGGAPALSAVSTVSGIGRVGELGDLAATFGRLLGDLRSSTDRLEDLVFKLATLNELVSLAARVPSIEALLDVVLERSMQGAGATIGSIMLLDPSAGTLRLAASRGLPADVGPGTEVSVREGIGGRVVESGIPLLVEDIERDPRFGRVNDPRYGSGSFISVPLKTANGVVGVVNLARKEVANGALATFGATDLQFLTTLVGYASYAIENAHLLQEAQEAAKRLGEMVEAERVRVRELAEKSRQLEEAKVEAETANRIKTQFLAVMSHELRTPLNSIIGFSKLLLNRRDGELTERQETHLKLVHASSVHLLGLIGAVLDMARIEADKVDLRPEAIDIGQLVDECVESSLPLTDGKALTISTDVTPGLPTLRADRMKVKQVLLNLIANAIKFTPSGRVIASARLVPEGVHVAVADTGVGIPESELPHVFEPFRRRGPSATHEGGTGLGLAISRSFVEAHGGRIWLESEEKRGSTVHFTLPLG